MSAKLKFNFETRNGKKFPVYDFMSIPEGLIEAINKRLRGKYGIDNERRKADSGYNCHGMTFIGKLGWVGCLDFQESILIISNTNQNTKKLITDRDIIEEILDGNRLHKSFRLNNLDVDFLSGDEDVEIGDIVVYKDTRAHGEEILHTAMVVEVIKSNNNIVNLRVLSKMGLGAEYFHLFNNIPEEYGKIIEVWTDRERRNEIHINR